MYAKGRGVLKNDATAVGWFRKAAEQGYAKAQYNLGVMYYNGVRLGVPQRMQTAVVEAADQGDARGCRVV